MGFECSVPASFVADKGRHLLCRGDNCVDEDALRGTAGCR